jgi:hypothetical protein
LPPFGETHMSQCYRHLRLDEREIVFRMKDARISVSKIAAQLVLFATSHTRPVQNLQIELRFAFRCHQAHGWAGSGFRDDLRFPVVGLQRFDIGLDIFRRHLSHRVPMRLGRSDSENARRITPPSPPRIAAAPSRLEVEITQAILLEQTEETLAILNQLHSRGERI